jgi:hypothetical protein
MDWHAKHLAHALKAGGQGVQVFQHIGVGGLVVEAVPDGVLTSGEFCEGEVFC